MALFGLADGIVADGLRSDEARREILSQISEALKQRALAPLVGEIVTQIRSEGQTAINQLNRTSEEGRSKLAAALKQEAETIRSEGQTAINQLNRTSEEVRSKLAAALKQEAETLRGDMVRQIEASLGSTEGKDLLTGLLVEALSRRALPVLIHDAEARLNEVTTAKVAELCTHAEITIEKSSEDCRAQLQCAVEAFNREAGAMILTLSEGVFREAEKQLQEKRESLIASSWGEVQRRLDDFIESRLNEITTAKVAELCAHAEITIEKSSEDYRAQLQCAVEAFNRREAGAMILTLSEGVFREAEKQLQEKRESLIASSWGEAQRRLGRFIDYDLPTALWDAVERHVANGPRFVHPHSNRWIAAELGISLREVKRRRRRGQL